MFDVQEELKKLPPKPGVYIMHDERDAIIYVGKAVNLHNRVGGADPGEQSDQGAPAKI